MSTSSISKENIIDIHYNIDEDMFHDLPNAPDDSSQPDPLLRRSTRPSKLHVDTWFCTNNLVKEDG